MQSPKDKNLILPGLFLLLIAVTAFAQTAEVRIDESSVLAAMQQPARLASDVERDVRSQPHKIIPLLNLAKGDRVIDIFGSGGYYSDLLARLLTEEGAAILHNNQGFEQWGSNILQDRYANGMPDNVVVHTRSGINLDLEPGRPQGLDVGQQQIFVLIKKGSFQKLKTDVSRWDVQSGD